MISLPVLIFPIFVSKSGFEIEKVNSSSGLLGKSGKHFVKEVFFYQNTKVNLNF